MLKRMLTAIRRNELHSLMLATNCNATHIQYHTLAQNNNYEDYNLNVT
jgi:hypothetical protein